MSNNKSIEEKIDILVDLTKQLLALELFKSGVPQQEIGKRIHVATAKVVEMLKGVKKER